MRHILDIDDLSKDEFAEVMRRCAEPNPPQVLADKGAGLIFEKASGRTRNSTEMAVVQLGGHPVSMKGDEVGIDTRETAEDVVRTLAAYHAVVGARVKDHKVLERMAAANVVPVLNLLSDVAHPCQAIADLLTLQDRIGAIDGLGIAFVGDFNNVARSLALACAYADVRLQVACPPAYGPSQLDLDRIAALGGHTKVTDRPEEAVTHADAVYTDVFVSMGQEAEAGARHVAFEGFRVTPELMAYAEEHAIFLHCLPAIRGSEVDAAVIDGPQSAVFEQAAKRLDAARGAIWWLVDNA
jgi:ornithine carbamoyltransferase